MSDLALLWGTDLIVGPTGDLGVTTGAALGQQRVIRRLMTNSGDYVWHPTYGAGLAAFVGSPSAADQIQAVILSQVGMETAVASSPAPIVSVTAEQGGQSDVVTADVQYVDASTDQTQQLGIVTGI
jgi:hypothetical protein